jgi:hypothetical protein
MHGSTGDQIDSAKRFHCLFVLHVEILQVQYKDTDADVWKWRFLC